MRRSVKIITRSLLGLAALVVALVVAGVIVVQTAWFRNAVRERMVSVVERATGGSVEIGNFSYDWRNLTAEVSPFILRGTEAPSAPPLFRADKIQIGLKIISALEKKVEVAEARADRFDLAEALLEIGLVITSVTLLTRSRIYWYFGMVSSLCGVISAASAYFLS